jgi:hypothetical protein
VRVLRRVGEGDAVQRVYAESVKVHHAKECCTYSGTHTAGGPAKPSCFPHLVPRFSVDVPEFELKSS